MVVRSVRRNGVSSLIIYTLFFLFKVASQTNYMIKDILNANDIPESTSLVLINAVYFNVRII